MNHDMFAWLGYQLRGFGLEPDFMEQSYAEDKIKVRFRDGRSCLISAMHIRAAQPSGALHEGAFRCQDCKALRTGDSFNWCRYSKNGTLRDCCMACYAVHLKPAADVQPVPMSEATRQFFAREDVAAWVAKVRP